MVIGVVSDTHMPRFGRELPLSLVRGLRAARVDVIVHCGDMTERIAIDLLQKIAPVIAVAGNNDGKPLHKEFGDRRILEAEGRRIGVVHGHAGKGRSTPDRAFKTFADENVDAILFGHSHVPYKTRREGILLFNPGSCTDKRFNPLYSYGIVRVDTRGVRATHRFYLSRTG